MAQTLRVNGVVCTTKKELEYQLGFAAPKLGEYVNDEWREHDDLTPCDFVACAALSNKSLIRHDGNLECELIARFKQSAGL